MRHESGVWPWVGTLLSGHLLPSADSKSSMLRKESHSQAAAFFPGRPLATMEISADPNLSLLPCSWKSYKQFKHSLFLCPRVWWHFSPAACHAELFIGSLSRTFDQAAVERVWNGGPGLGMQRHTAGSACVLGQNRMAAVVGFPKCLGFHLTKERAFLMDWTGDRRIFVLSIY